jgi:hypothetical protein
MMEFMKLSLSEMGIFIGFSAGSNSLNSFLLPIYICIDFVWLPILYLKLKTESWFFFFFKKIKKKKKKKKKNF